MKLSSILARLRLIPRCPPAQPPCRAIALLKPGACRASYFRISMRSSAWGWSWSWSSWSFSLQGLAEQDYEILW